MVFDVLVNRKAFLKRVCLHLPICAAMAISAPAQTFTTLVDFSLFNGTKGARPNGPVVQGTDGKLYGTTNTGAGPTSYGTVFNLTPAGKLTVVHSFNSTDGANPAAGLLLATNDNFYGTTEYGGQTSVYCNYGCGTIFKNHPERHANYPPGV
jgi:uncharacterized repeat protein (TIGR03803 family)